MNTVGELIGKCAPSVSSDPVMALATDGLSPAKSNVLQIVVQLAEDVLSYVTIEGGCSSATESITGLSPCRYDELKRPVREALLYLGALGPRFVAASAHSFVLPMLASLCAKAAPADVPQAPLQFVDLGGLYLAWASGLLHEFASDEKLMDGGPGVFEAWLYDETHSTRKRPGLKRMCELASIQEDFGADSNGLSAVQNCRKAWEARRRLMRMPIRLSAPPGSVAMI